MNPRRALFQWDNGEPLLPFPRLGHLLSFSAFILGLSCTDPSPSSSSGVRWNSPDSIPPTWDFTGGPDLQIGSIEGSSASQFNMVSGVLVGASGRIWVLDRGSGELRLFDLDGNHVLTTGGRGQGPGEFQRPRFLGETKGDSVLVWDDGLSRMSVYLADGTFDRTEAPPVQSGMAPRPLALLPDGRMVGQFPHLFQGTLAEGEVFTDTLRLWRTDRTFTDTLLLAKPGVTEWIWMGTDQFQVPFTVGVRFAVAAERILVLPGSEVVFTEFDKSGEVKGRFGIQWPERAVTPAARAQFRDYIDGVRTPEGRKTAWKGLLDHPAVPSALPHYDALLGASNGELWARRYEIHREAESTWDVFGRDGIWRAVAEFDSDFDLYGVTTEWAFGVWRDEYDVEYVQLRRRSQ